MNLKSTEQEELSLFTDDDDSVVTEEVEDAEESEEVEDGDSEESEEGAEETEEDSDAPVEFTEKQQEIIDNLIKTRLERQEATIRKEFQKTLDAAAGVKLEGDDNTRAARLWGFLKVNPAVSRVVQQAIDGFVAREKVVEPAQRSNEKELALSRREAILDLKSEDTYFSKYSARILEWADEEEFDVHDTKSLKRAYMAFKGSDEGKLLQADEELKRSRTSKKTQQKPKTKVAMKPSSGGKSQAKNLDYKKMSARDILVSEGINLFTDD
jgi:hypothetical protein